MFLNWAFLFLILALVAAVLGFGGIAQQSAGIAKILFIVFLIIFQFKKLPWLLPFPTTHFFCNLEKNKLPCSIQRRSQL